MAELSLSICPVSRDAMRASLVSLKQVADRGVDISDVAIELTGINAGDLFAFRANNLPIALEPSDRFRDHIAAIAARDFDGFSVEIEVRHSWPILSVVDRTTTVAEAGSASSAPGGGQVA